jgi:hypothetical protein
VVLDRQRNYVTSYQNYSQYIKQWTATDPKSVLVSRYVYILLDKLDWECNAMFPYLIQGLKKVFAI